MLAYVMSELNHRHNYGLDLFLLSVDEGITGYRDDSLETVKRNEIQVCGSCITPKRVNYSSVCRSITMSCSCLQPLWESKCLSKDRYVLG